MGPKVSVIIPTQRRPAGLKLAVRSVIAQEQVDFALIELVVVDNDLTDREKDAVLALQSEAAFPIVYVHEPTPGVTNARNAGLSAARGEEVVFIDDDEEAASLWLYELFKVQAKFDADVVWGPVLGRTAKEVVEHKAYLDRFFSRLGPEEDRVIARHYGCGNSLVRRSALPNPDAPFDPQYNATGGEDDVLFSELKRRGCKFAWAAHAAVWEDPAPHRASLGYAVPRAFAYGQGGTYFRAKFGSPKAVVWSMITGAGQALVFGAVAGPLWLLRSKNRAFMLDRAARGLGKVFWTRSFHIQFYGQGAEPSPPAAKSENAVP